jgi:N-dimethylarginine dimethylaminohydrolase
MTMEITANPTNIQERANLPIEHSLEGVTTVSEATAVLAMSRPEYFEVSYTINPWMQPTDWQSRAVELLEKAQRGWKVMYETFRSMGISIQLVPACQGLPDMVFTANAAIVLNKKALLSRFRYKERQGEESHYAEFFKGLKGTGVLEDVQSIPEGIFQEGAGDCHWDASRQLFWAGYGPRSCKEAIPYIESYFGKPVVALELASDQFYHIDVSLCPLSGGEIIYYPGAFTEKSLSILLERVPQDKLISITREDAAVFAANAVNSEKRLIMARCSEALERQLQEHGYSVTRVPVETFAMSGGSVFCMTLRLDRQSSK